MLADFYIYIGFALFAGTYVLGDALFGEDISTPKLSHKWAINAMLYGSVPLCCVLIGICAWLVSPHNPELITNISAFTGYDFAHAKANTSVQALIIAVVFAAFMLSGIATVVAHEFVHRLGSKIDVCIGRWLLAFSIDANFSIEHVYNHHAKVATTEDPVTAIRGRNVYVHLIYAIYGTTKSAWRIEVKRLTRKNQSIFTWHNRFIRGYLMSICYLSLAGILAGWQASVFLFAIGASAKIILEIVNYIEHYGLVRHPKQPVKPKHSWNSNRKISNWAMFNLPRHSHHHAQAAVPFEKLAPMQDAPQMISGYISTIVIALIPPLWFKLMAPKLEIWDKHHANSQELKIIEQQAVLKNRMHPILRLLA